MEPNFQADRPGLERAGIHVHPDCRVYVREEWKHDARLAMDATMPLVTEANAGVPIALTTMIDPEVIRVITSPLEFAKMLGGERQKGDWTTATAMFGVIEATGEVSSYGDFNNNGRAGINLNWPNFQSYLFQVFIRYGELEADRASLAKINYVAELQRAAALQLNTFGNLSYAFGIDGLQNYGLLNNPYLSATLTPAIKAWGGTTWFNNGVAAATANEVYNDILALVSQVIAQSGGAIKKTDKFVLAMSPGSDVATLFANSFGVYVMDLLKKGLPNLEIVTAPQYGLQSTLNPQGFTSAGNYMQLITLTVDGQEVAYPAYNEKMRAHKIIPEPSSWLQKQTSGTWGTILRMPFAISTMTGI